MGSLDSPGTVAESLGIKFMRTCVLFAVVLYLLKAASPTSGLISGGMVAGGSAAVGGGTFVILTPPLTNAFGPTNTVGSDNFESLNLFGFNELQDVLLTSNLVVDVGSSPIPAGTVISSHYVFFDPATNENIAGVVGFVTNVLGVIASNTNLANSDFLAAPGVSYAAPAARGLEPGDSVSISGAKQIMVQLSAGSPGDYIRVITQGVKTPDPVVNIGLDGTNCVVSWLTNLAGFTLQFSTGLSSPIHWTNHPAKPVVLDQEFKITDELSSGVRFFPAQWDPKLGIHVT